MSRFVCFFAHSILPLFVGGMLYFVDVPDGMLDLIRNHLPDFLWAYALGSLLQLVWRGHPYHSRSWLLIAGLLALSLECMQALGWIRGTFDLLDIGMYVLALAVVWYLSSFQSYSKSI